MAYRNLTTRGTLNRIIYYGSADQANNPALHKPDHLDVTRVEIKGPGGSIFCPEIYGSISPEHIGKSVRLIQSYDRTPKLKIFSQEFYVGSKQVVNATVQMER
jgi:hypothetical protein